MFRRFAMTTIAFAVIAVSQAHAGPFTRSVTVDYSDLDINRSAGAQVLLLRINHAATQACGGRPDASYRFIAQPMVNAFQRCHDEAVRNAVASIPSPALARAYAGEYPNAPLNQFAGR